MTLRHFLNQNKIHLDKKAEVRIGEILSDKYRERYHKSAPKTKIDEIENPVNDYPIEFLEECEVAIIQFLTAVTEKP